MKKTVIIAAALVICAAIGSPAAAQTVYTVSVAPDEATAGELGMLGSALLAAAEGDASQSIRKLAAGVVGELRILMNQRVTNDALTLDDGSVVTLLEGDTITLVEECNPEKEECTGDKKHGAEIIWSKGGHGPASIFIKTGDGCSRVIQFVTGGRPTIYAKCPVK